MFDESHPASGYFYVDDYFLHHRMVFMNTNETYENAIGRPYVENNGTVHYSVYGVTIIHQIDWLVNRAFDMTGKTDWTVSLFSHICPYSDKDESDKSEFHGYGEDFPEIRAVVKAFKEGTSVSVQYPAVDTDTHEWKAITVTKDFALQGTVKVTGWYSGHIHDDCHRKVDDINIAISTCTMADWRKSWGNDPTPSKLPPERNNAELAMSVNVFVINTDTRTVNVVKVGSKRDNAVKTSSDYEFSY